MLSRLILLLVQLGVGYFGAIRIVPYIPPLGAGTRLFVYAVVMAVLVWIVGLVLAQVLRETGAPSSATLAAALVLALIGAAIYTWLPLILPESRSVLRNLTELAYPLLGAVLGYQLRR